MNISIQRADAREFLAAPPDEWVRDPHEALHFNNTRSAVAYCKQHRLENVRLVVFFRDRLMSLLLYVRGQGTPTPAGALKAAA